MSAFRSTTRLLPVPQEPELEHEIAAVVELLYERAEAQEAVHGFAENAHDQIQVDHDAVSADIYCQSLMRLGDQLLRILEDLRLYDAQGLLRYEFDRLLGCDIVLRANHPELMCT